MSPRSPQHKALSDWGQSLLDGPARRSHFTEGSHRAFLTCLRRLRRRRPFTRPELLPEGRKKKTCSYIQTRRGACARGFCDLPVITQQGHGAKALEKSV